SSPLRTDIWQSPLRRGSASASTKRPCAAAPKPVIAGARRCGGMPTDPLRSGDMKPTHRRYGVMLMLFVSVVVTYLDRSNLSIAAPAMRAELSIDTVHMGWILSAFGWTYAFCQIPGGWLVDRVAPRFFYPAILVLWSLATVTMGLVGSVAALIAIRLCIGFLEAPSYSINNQV